MEDNTSTPESKDERRKNCYLALVMLLLFVASLLGYENIKMQAEIAALSTSMRHGDASVTVNANLCDERSTGLVTNVGGPIVTIPPNKRNKSSKFIDEPIDPIFPPDRIISGEKPTKKTKENPVVKTKEPIDVPVVKYPILIIDHTKGDGVPGVKLPGWHGGGNNNPTKPDDIPNILVGNTVPPSNNDGDIEAVVSGSFKRSYEWKRCLHF